MALAKAGGGVTDIRGSISGNTFSRNRGGMIVRARTVPTNTRSSSQSKSRSLFSFLNEAWHTNLTPTQRTAWDTYAHAVIDHNKLGEPIHLTGQLQFLRTNQARLTAGLSLCESAPTILALAETDPTLIAYAGSTYQTIAIYFDTTEPWINEDDAALIVHVGRPVGKTINYYTGPWQSLGVIHGSSTAPPASPYYLYNPPVRIATGQKVWFKIEIARADGRIGGPWTYSCIVADHALPLGYFLKETFNSYTAGSLRLQGEWSGDTAFEVQGSVVYEGAKAIKITSTAYKFIVKTGTPIEAGELSIRMRKDVSTGGISTTQKIVFDEVTMLEVCNVGMRGANIVYVSSGSNVTLLLNYSLATWYKITMQWRGAPDYLVRYKVNDGAWTDWVTRPSATSVLPPLRCILPINLFSGGAIGYYDFID